MEQLERRVTHLEDTFRAHVAFDENAHVRLEAAVKENTELTQQISRNTSEIVDIVKGAKGMRKFVVWVAPIAAISYEGWQWLKEHLH